MSSFSRSNRALIFGGSFNPPHVGHVIILNYAIEDFDGDVFILPTHVPPHKVVDVPYEKRFQWARETFKVLRYPKLYLYDLEPHIQGVNYAIKNVEHFLSYYKEIVLLVGEDALGNIERWYEYERLLSLCRFLVYPRTRDGSLFARGKMILGELYDKSVVELNAPLIEISSSEIRERVRLGKSIVGMVPYDLLDDIESTLKNFYSGRSDGVDCE
ncbi:nicotinate-nucleotide adenylyltransferase [Fervidobacterium thailandense]|uniref:Probable nicotinate-nucleotide adenylyltransferase n=1 Tax=Fervidobacterium thailandense TaxID=1008305 RepID=A0A1E3G543_9BACT|nr:nicotinate-nucleotide adenylyltransferase [Fervidobacterium thailandense]